MIHIAGNHDTLVGKDNKVMMSVGGIYLENSSVDFNGYTIFGTPDSLPYRRGWAFNTPECEIWQHLLTAPKKVDILITHGPPYGVADLVKYHGHCGSQALRQWIRNNQPKLVICGHLHDNFGFHSLGSTTVVSCSLMDGYCNDRKQILAGEL